MATNKETHMLYDGTIAIDFYPDSHRYKIVGEKTYLTSVTSATGIIDKSRVLVGWAVRLDFGHLRNLLEPLTGQKLTVEEIWPLIEEAEKQHDIKKEAAADFGSQVHEFAENFAKFKIGKLPKSPEITDDMPEEVINGINAFLSWYNENDVQFIEAEKLIYSKKHGFVGMTDVIARVNGRLMLIDYKTGKGVYSEAHYQVAGYVMGYEEETDLRVDAALILNFNKETGDLNDPVLIEREELDRNAETFLHCFAIKQREKEMTSAFYQNKTVAAA